MSRRDYHLNFSDMEKKKLGNKVIDVFDLCGKRNVLIYEVFAALISELGLNDAAPEETVRKIEAWIDSNLYGKSPGSDEPIRPDRNETENSTGRDGSEVDVKSGRVTGKYDMASFMGNSRFSEITGGI